MILDEKITEMEKKTRSQASIHRAMIDNDISINVGVIGKSSHNASLGEPENISVRQGGGMNPETYNHKNSEAKPSDALTPAPAALHQKIKYKRSKQESDFLS